MDAVSERRYRYLDSQHLCTPGPRRRVDPRPHPTHAGRTAPRAANGGSCTRRQRRRDGGANAADVCGTT
jgi:hypothetical protein